MKYVDYYATLGVARDANLDAIKKAYRKLARQYHPDVSKDKDAEQRFKEAAEAYATLKHPEKRAAYDALGQKSVDEEFAPPPNWGGDPGSNTAHFDDDDLADFLASFGQGRGQHARAPVPRKGRDYESGITLSVEELHHGCQRSLDLSDEGGARQLNVAVPPGVSEGQKLRLKGKGGKGRDGGADGDIYLHIAVKPHPVFRVDHHNLYVNLALSPWEAVLGAEVEVPTLEGPAVLTVPAGTHAGRKLRLRGRGLVNRHGERGDWYALVHIDVPAAVTDQERELFASLASVSQFNPRQPEKKAHQNDSTPL